MELQVRAMQIGGSLAVIIPKELVEKERIFANDKLKIKVEKSDNLDFLWGKNKDVKKSTKKIMEEIDEGELNG